MNPENPTEAFRLRAIAGLTVAEAAARLGVTPRAWRNWEAGTPEMPAKKAQAFKYPTETASVRVGAALDELLDLAARPAPAWYGADNPYGQRQAAPLRRVTPDPASDPASDSDPNRGLGTVSDTALTGEDLQEIATRTLT